jgi:competence protein ComEC
VYLLPAWAQALWWLSNKILIVLWFYLEYLAHLPFATISLIVPNVFILVLSLLGLLLLLAPKGVPLKYLGVFFILPLFFHLTKRPRNGEFEFVMLDVGQGLSCVVITHTHVLVYDTGPSYKDGFDSGSNVVVPFLRYKDINRIDELVISHADNDHAGGAESVISNIKTDKVIQPPVCHTHKPWVWDGVKFRFIQGSSRYSSRNNQSCILKVSAKDESLLLPGDIEKSQEKYLVRHKALILKSTILVAPHHGSLTSSTEGFVKAVDPKIVLFSVGFMNRFSFPKRKVIYRYKAIGSRVYSTADNGAVSFLVK